MQNINRVILTGNLTREPELRQTSSMAVCSMRIAVNGRTKDNDTGQWGDKPNYFDVTVFGSQGENCARYLAKGRGIAVDGRLDWREWTTPEGQKRQAVQVIAENVQFLSDGTGSPSGRSETAAPAPSDFGPGDFPVPAATGAAADDDIPF